MRGADEQPGSMFSYVSLEERVPADHPLRAIRRITDRALERLSPRFGTLYIHFGRPSIPPEKLLRALLLQALYTIRSERQLMEQLDYNLLFRWFVGLGLDDAVWSPSTFSKNRDRLLDGDIAAAFFDAILLHADTERLLSDEHFTVDGTLLESWASQKSFRPRDSDPDGSGPAPGNFHGERRRNATHQSTTDPDARLYKKARGREARLGYLGHVLMEHRSGLIVNARVTPADGYGERDAALVMIEGCRGRHRITIAADKAYDTRGFVANLRAMGATPHVAQYTARAPAQCHRRAHHATRRVCEESAATQAGRAKLRMDEDRGRLAEAPSPWRTVGDLDLYLHRGGVQHRPSAAAAVGHRMSTPPSRRVAPRARVSATGERHECPRGFGIMNVTFSMAC
jgi:transposase